MRLHLENGAVGGVVMGRWWGDTAETLEQGQSLWVQTRDAGFTLPKPSLPNQRHLTASIGSGLNDRIYNVNKFLCKRRFQPPSSHSPQTWRERGSGKGAEGSGPAKQQAPVPGGPHRTKALIPAPTSSEPDEQAIPSPDPVIGLNLTRWAPRPKLRPFQRRTKSEISASRKRNSFLALSLAQLQPFGGDIPL